MLFQESTPEGYVSYGSYVGIYYEGALMILMILLLINLFRIYNVSKLRMTLDVFLGFLFYLFGLFFAWLGKIYLWHHMESALEGPYLLQLIYKFKFSSACVVIGNYFLLRFFRAIFNKDYSKKRQMILLTIKTIEVSIILLIHIPAFLARSTEIAYTSDAIAFLIMFLDSLFVIPYGTKAFKSVKKEAFGKKYINIGIMAFCLLNMCIMFLLDRITMLMGMMGPFGEPGYTVFYFTAWGSAIAATVFAIYGFVRK